MLKRDLGFLQVTIIGSICLAMTHPIDVLLQFWKFHMLTCDLGFLQVTILRYISVAMTHPIYVL